MVDCREGNIKTMEKEGKILKFEDVTENSREGTEIVYESIYLLEKIE